MFILLFALSFIFVGALIAAFQDKRSAIPALVVGALAGILCALFMLQAATAFIPETQENVSGFILIGALSFMVPFGTTMLGHWLVATYRWDRLTRPLAQEHDGGTGGDEGEA